SMAGAEHLGLGSIASHLRSRGFTATQINYQLSTFFNAWDGLVDYRGSYSAEALAAEILSTRPDVVGFCVTSMTLLETLKMCEIIRARSPRTLLGLGGPHAILCANELMSRFPVLDFIGMNDGERAMALLADAIVDGVFPCAIPEMITRAPERIDAGVMSSYKAMPRGVDDLPMPARDDLLWMLLRAPITEARITTSRGCNYDCTFCIDAMRYDRRWLSRSASQTVDEMEALNRCLGISHFWMSDDNFVTGAPSSRRRAREIADQLQARGLDVTYRVRFRSDTFVDDLPLLERLAESGLVSAFVGLEAGSEEQLERFKKRTTVNQHYVMVEQMRALGIALQCGFIMFEPYASFDDLAASATFLHDIKEMYLESNFTHSLDVFPGTEIAEDLRRDGLLYPNFTATSPYDAYDFSDRHLGTFARLIEKSHDYDTVTRDKWLYRYRTNLLPRAHRRLRHHAKRTEWRAREEAVIQRLNDANMTFFMSALDEARRGEPGRQFDAFRDAAFKVQREGERELADLYREVLSCLPEDRSARRRVGPSGTVSSDHPELPPAVQARLLEAQRSLEGQGPFVTRLLGGGNLNWIVLLEGPERRFVFRTRRHDSTAEISAYLARLYGDADLEGRGGRFRLRSVTEQADFIAKARAAGVRTPAVAATGEDWIVTAFEEGRTLAEELQDAGGPEIVLRLLFQLASAHRAGIVFGDRWGANEIVDPAGHLHFIDFDVEWTPRSPRHRLNELDAGVAIFGALLNSTRRDDLLEALRVYGVPLLAEWGYDLPSVAAVLDGYRAFYLAPDKTAGPWSPPFSTYEALAPSLDAAVQTLRDCRPSTIVGQLI